MGTGERRSENLRRAVRSTVKEAVWLTTRHRPDDRSDVMLFASRRGGSTWLMEVIAGAPGFRSLDQPFSVMTANLTPGQYRTVPKYAYGEIVCPPPEDLPAIEAYVERLLAGEIPVNAPYRFWKPGFRRRTSRQVIKTVGAKSLICWIDDSFDVDVVYLTRHPITQALSCIRNDWTLTVRAFLDNERFVGAHLDAGLEARCHDILARGNPLDRFVLNWGLENLVPMRELGSRPDWILSSYESTVLRPEESAVELADRLDLGPSEEIVARLRRPSGSSRLSTTVRRDAMSSGDAEVLLRSPLDEVDLADRRSAMGVLDALGAAAYRPDEIEPEFDR